MMTCRKLIYINQHHFYSMQSSRQKKTLKLYVENGFSFNLKTNCSLLIMRLLDNTDLNQFTTSITQGTTELNFT